MGVPEIFETFLEADHPGESWISSVAPTLEADVLTLSDSLGSSSSTLLNDTWTLCNPNNWTGSENSTTVTVESNPYVLPWWHKLIWSVLFGGMVLVATGGNLIVIWIVLTHQNMRTVTNIFLVNLSIADTMVSTLNVVFNFTYMLEGDWVFGRLYCKINSFVAVVSVSASVFTLMAISFDRYVAILHPLRPRMGRKTTILIVAWIWIVSFSVSIPNFLFFTTDSVALPHGGVRVVCYGSWPDGDQGESTSEHVHTVVLMVLTYILPVVGMGFTYSRMGSALWGSQSIGEQTPRHIETIRSKRKVVKMMIVVVVIFAVCWLPYHLYFILYTYIPSINQLTHIQDIYLAIYWLAMSNSMYNPMIYCWLNSRFRNGFRQVFSWWLPCVSAERMGTERPRAHTTRVSYSGSPETRHRDGGSQPTSSYMQVSDSTHLAPLVLRSPRSAR